jgi:cbb3-type cytochrome oxidase subunit 3
LTANNLLLNFLFRFDVCLKFACMTKRSSWIVVLVVMFLLFIATSVFRTHRKKQLEKAEKEKLALRYSEGLKVIYDKDNFFCAEAQYAHWDSVMHSAVPEADKLIAQRFVSVILLRMGDEKKAIQFLLDLVEKTKATPTDRIAVDAKNYLALAYLRLGERNNCISNHASGSCIFPIQGSGIYLDPAASLKSIDVYSEILKQSPDDLDARWLLNIAYMTIGGYPARVPAQWLIKGLDTDSAMVKVKPFQDIAGSLKLNSFRNLSGGSIVDDFNNDGYLDIVTSSMSLDESMHYFQNNKDGTFTDVSQQSGLAGIKGGLNIIQADYNNDGFTDILVLRGAWMQEFGKQPVSLLRNNGDGTFTDVTLESGIISFNPTQTATWADFNNDGWLDLFIGMETTSPEHPHPAKLFINNHDGSFTEVSHQAGCDIVCYAKGVVSADYNNDGWPDIFISSLDGNKTLLKNKAVKSNIPLFENATHEAGLDLKMTYTFPTWFWDYDNDGWPDIFVCGYLFNGSLAKTSAAEALHMPLGDVSKMYLYHNNQDGTFSDVSRGMGLDRPVFAMGSNFGDMDNDGWPDMYLGTGNPDLKSLVPNRMFKNMGGREFVDVTNSARLGNLQKGHGVSFADMDNDGDQDIFIEVGGPFKGDAYYNAFYLNPGQNNNNWISILLEGVHAPRSAIGARLAVSFTEDGIKRTVYRDVNSGGSFGASPLRQEIGIGRATTIDELKVTWPSLGKTQVFKNLAPRQFIRIKEGIDTPEVMDLKTLKFDTTHNMGGMKMVM